MVFDEQKLSDRIAENEDKIKNLENEKERILRSGNARVKKERTKQLIRMGELVEKYFGFHDAIYFEEYLKKSGKK